MGFVNRKRQREEEEEGGRASASGESRLANWMLEQMAWGLLSPAQCQVIASLVEDEMQSEGCTPHSTVSQLANLGSRGRYVNNVWRDMQKLFGAIRICHPKVHTLSLKRGNKTGSFASPSLWPHELFANLFHEYPNAWKKYICPSRSRLTSFWSQLAATSLWKNHPLAGPNCDPTFCSFECISASMVTCAAFHGRMCCNLWRVFVLIQISDISCPRYCKAYHCHCMETAFLSLTSDQRIRATSNWFRGGHCFRKLCLIL